ncbi:MAG: head GIN domain-containing protein [Chitinophagaceae bacterium]
MKKITTMALLSITTVGMIACSKAIMGEGPVVAQNRPITSFMGIDLLINADVYYQAGDNLNLEVTGQQNILDNIETTVTEGNLVIQSSNGRSFTADENIRINITTPEINRFLINSSGSIYCLSDIQTSKLLLSNSGSGTISLKDVTAKNIEATNTSSGNIIALDGTAVSETAGNSGTGKIDLSGILTRRATVRTSGSGKIQVKVADHLYATIEDGGPVYYSGYPDVSSHISGTGHLVHF